MKILLAHAYFIHQDRVEQQVMRPYPPLGLLSVSAYLDQKEIEHEVYDGTFSNEMEFMQLIDNFVPDCIAFYVNFLTRIKVLMIIKKLKQDNRNIKFILGGPDVRYNAAEYLENGADYLVIGEGEESLYELIIALQNEKDPGAVLGIAYLNDQGKCHTSEERKHFVSLDQLPVPNRKKIEISNYLEAWKMSHGYSSITVNTQRGCPYTCNWCSHAVFGDTYRRRSPVSVVEELIILDQTYAPDSYWFVDDVFTMSSKWLENFKTELQIKDLKISYECITRADRLNQETIQLLKDTGCNMLWIGAESGSQKIIDFMDRRVDVQLVREMIRLASGLDIKTGTFIMLGYPGETMADIRKTVEHLKIAKPDIFTINLAYPINGTRLYTQVKKQIINGVDWASTPDRDLNFERTYKKGFYTWAIRMVYNEVYAHQYRMKKLWIKAAKLKIKALISAVLMQFYRI